MSARRSPSLRSVLLAAAASVAALAAASVHARCIDELEDSGPVAAAAPADSAPIEPRRTLQSLVREALSRSFSVGAAKLLADAAIDDIAEARAARELHVGLNADLGPNVINSSIGTSSLLQAHASINATKLLYDGGRSGHLIDWRAQLAEAARHGHLSQQEQLALNTVVLTLERSRLRQHVIVYGQQVRKMSCLVDALQTIVQADRGRASELVQARKSLQQAELSQSQAQSQSRQVDIRLRRLVGDGLPGIEGMSSVLLHVPELNTIESEVARSTDIAQLSAQAEAMGQYAAAVAAGDKPQVSWSIGGAKTLSAGPGSVDQRGGNFGLGLTISVPLVDPGVAPAADAARKRAQAAVLQREEALQQRQFRVREVHEQTLSAFDRATRVAAVLKDSNQVRNFTLQQWQQLGRRSLFDVMSAESDHYNLRVAYLDALYDGEQMNALLLSLGRGVTEWLR